MQLRFAQIQEPIMMILESLTEPPKNPETLLEIVREIQLPFHSNYRQPWLPLPPTTVTMFIMAILPFPALDQLIQIHHLRKFKWKAPIQLAIGPLQTQPALPLLKTQV
jgi:hypothetical protein